MSGHTCRYGNKRRKRPVTSYNALLDLPTRMAEDDGVVVPIQCAECDKNSELPHPNCVKFYPVCNDCGKGTLTWAEGGFVPWHRICNVCGSHWDLHPHEGFYRRARFH